MSLFIGVSFLAQDAADQKNDNYKILYIVLHIFQG